MLLLSGTPGSVKATESRRVVFWGKYVARSKSLLRFGGRSTVEQ